MVLVMCVIFFIVIFDCGVYMMFELEIVVFVVVVDVWYLVDVVVCLFDE